MPAVREAVVDGLFYPAAPGALRAQIVDYLAGVVAAGLKIGAAEPPPRSSQVARTALDAVRPHY